MSLTNGSRDLLPSPGPPFEVGERVAFFPAEIGPTSIWLRLDYAVIVDIDSEAETVGFYFESRPGERHAQGMENIVRITPNYVAWREAWERAFALTGDEQAAERETEPLRLRVITEHPIHGHELTRPGDIRAR